MTEWLNFRKNYFLWVFIIGIIVIGLIVFVQTQKILSDITDVSNDVKTKLDNTNDLLTKLNSNLQGLDSLNQNILGIKSDISNIKTEISKLPDGTSLNRIETDISNINQEVTALAKVYPNQTVILNNINQEDLNKIINNAVYIEFTKISGKVQINFILNIIFGALLSIGGISLAVYFVYNKKNNVE